MDIDVTTLPTWVQWLFYVLVVVFQVIQMVAYRSATKKKLNEQKKQTEALEEMNYRKSDYRAAEVQDGKDPQAQSFSTKKDELRLNKRSGQLEKVGEVDLVELAQQDADCALSKLLDKFGYDIVAQSCVSHGIGTAPVVGNSDEPLLDDYLDDLEELQAGFVYFEDVKQRYGFDPSLTPAQVLEKLSAMSEDLKAKIYKNGGKKNEEAQTPDEKK